jgi:hypothetical protein
VHCAPLGVRNPLKFKKNMTLVKKGQRSNKKRQELKILGTSGKIAEN